MSKKLFAVCLLAGASAWYCRTPSGRQDASAKINSIRHLVADWIKPVAPEIEEDQVFNEVNSVGFEGEEWDGEVPTDFLDTVESTTPD